MNIKKSFRVKVLVPIMIIFTVSVSVISGVSYSLFNTTVNKETNAYLEFFTNDILVQMNHVGTILDIMKQTLNEKHLAIAKSVSDILAGASYDMTAEELWRIAEPLDIIELSIADSDGILTHSSMPDFPGFDYGAHEPTKKYLDLADGTLTELSEEPRLSLLPNGLAGDINHYVGVSRADGKGFIQVGFNAEVVRRLQDTINIEKIIKETKIGYNGYGMLLMDGEILIHPDDNMTGKDVSGEDWYKTVVSEDGFSWITIGSTSYYAGYKNTDTHTIVGLVPRGDYYRELNWVLVYTALLLFVSIFIMIAVVYLTLGRKLQPIKHLVNGLGEISKGNLDFRIESHYNDEFDEIKDAVNTMASEIKKREAIVSGVDYAGKIQKNLLPPDDDMAKAFSDYSVIWKPRDIVGGDIYWMKQFEKGVVLCICDCTGHGTPGALLTMLVTSALEAIIWPSNCDDTAGIIWRLDQRLSTVLHVDSGTDNNRGISDIDDGCDVAVLFIAVDGSVRFSSGNISVFICDGTEVAQYKGQKIFIGEGKLTSKEDVAVHDIPANPDNKYYVASDGLFDQIGGKQSKSFGHAVFKKIILSKHNEKQSVITAGIWDAFEKYRGDEPQRDDFELVAFKPVGDKYAPDTDKLSAV